MSDKSKRKSLKGLREAVSARASLLSELSKGAVRSFSDSLSARMNAVSDVSSRRRVVRVVFLAGLCVIALNFVRVRSCSRKAAPFSVTAPSDTLSAQKGSDSLSVFRGL